MDGVLYASRNNWGTRNLGNYHILEKIGAGTYGYVWLLHTSWKDLVRYGSTSLCRHVYKARDVKNDKLVALKKLLRHHVEDGVCCCVPLMSSDVY